MAERYSPSLVILLICYTWMIGDVKRAYALTSNFAHKNIIEFEDTGVVALEFMNGALGTINYTVNSFNKNMEGSLTIFAEKGTVKIGGEYLNELEYQNIEGFEFKDFPRGNKAITMALMLVPCQIMIRYMKM